MVGSPVPSNQSVPVKPSRCEVSVFSKKGFMVILAFLVSQILILLLSFYKILYFLRYSKVDVGGLKFLTVLTLWPYLSCFWIMAASYFNLFNYSNSSTSCSSVVYGCCSILAYMRVHRSEWLGDWNPQMKIRHWNHSSVRVPSLNLLPSWLTIYEYVTRLSASRLIRFRQWYIALNNEDGPPKPFYQGLNSLLFGLMSHPAERKIIYRVCSAYPIFHKSKRTSVLSYLSARSKMNMTQI